MKKRKSRLKYSFYEIVNFLNEHEIDDEDFESSMGEGAFEGCEVTETKHVTYVVNDRLYVITLHSDYLDRKKSYKRVMIINKLNHIRDVRIEIDTNNNLKMYNVKNHIAFKDIKRYYNPIFLSKKLERELRKKKEELKNKNKNKI
ncbi:hypothetical protein LPN04_26470 [Rugamonas sp. A1-17]|nr:hypothetical protein [Rugamonas sp. A1-17]